MIINIEKPLRLFLEVVETEEHVPSMKMQITADVIQFGHELTYRGTTWIACAAWDAFVHGLAESGTSEVALVDMGNHFTLMLGNANGSLELVWEMKKRDASGCVSTASFRAPIDPDTYAHVALQFREFERWW